MSYYNKLFMSIETDSDKLDNRIHENKKFQTFDITSWIINTITIKNEEKLLDIGCGTGEQLIPYAELNPKSSMFGFDYSDISIQKLSKKLKEKKISNISLMCGDMDSLLDLVKERDFDIVTSCFALYYSKDIPKIIHSIKKLLNKNGRIFICGPKDGNNQELINFQSSISPDSIPKISYHMTESILPQIKKNFFNVKEFEFLNPIVFDNPISLLNYWKSYYLYDENIEKQFKKHLSEYFIKNSKFITTKKTIGILGSIQ